MRDLLAPSALIVRRSDRLARGNVKDARGLVQVVIWAIEHDVQSVQDPAAFPDVADPNMRLILGGIASPEHPCEGHHPSDGDPEQELLDHLAVLKATVADGVEQAPNLNALRNVLAELFDRVQLVKGDDLSPLSTNAGDGLDDLEVPPVGGLWLVPIIRGAALEDELEPVPAARARTYGREG